MRRAALRHVKGKKWHTTSLRQRMKRLVLQRVRHRILVGDNKESEDCLPRRSTRVQNMDQAPKVSITLPFRISSGDESGLKVCHFVDMGRGVVATRVFLRGEPLAEYKGELISEEEGLNREENMLSDLGSYLFFFKYGKQKMCIDATSEENTSIARLINHSRLEPNCKMKILTGDDGVSHLVLFAIKDIDVGSQLLYDYGDRRSSAIKNFPWLRTT